MSGKFGDLSKKTVNVFNDLTSFSYHGIMYLASGGFSYWVHMPTMVQLYATGLHPEL